MNLTDETLTTTTVPAEEPPEVGSSIAQSNASMQEYYQLQQRLLLVTLTIAAIAFACVWIFYSLNIALNYLLGASTGVVYLRMLAKDVERLGGEKKRVGPNRLTLFIGLMVVATQWHSLQILPIFLGFLTYKAALIFYILQTTLMPDPK